MRETVTLKDVLAAAEIPVFLIRHAQRARRRPVRRQA